MQLVIDFLEEIVLKYPSKIAVIDIDEKVTYEKLLNNSQKIGSFLVNKININEPVIVFMDKGVKTLETFLGIIYGGGCYSLINPDFPDNRIEQISNVLNSKIVITDKNNLAKANLVFKDKDIFNIEDVLKTRLNLRKLKNVRINKTDLDPVYINFTSGSTGVPKGVIVGNRSIIDFIEIFTKNFNITDKDIIGNQAPFDFDVSVKDIYSSLLVGATLVIIPKKYFSAPALLLDFLVENKITTLIWAVSALCLITTFHGLDYKVPTDVNKIIFSGEVMPIKHLEMWRNKLPNALFVNVYGPTEITCNCTYYIIPKNKKLDVIPIGKNFENEKVFLLDENNKEINTKGKIGEICVSGTCLALGYFNNREQTNKVFIQNPLNNSYNELIYKTGDLAKYDENNDLIFMGRKDFQIKYMGHRIELEEIEREILKIKEIKRVCVLFSEKKNKLCCFYIGEIDKNEIANILRVKLPEYMIPSIFNKIDEFILNKNGKIDRKILLDIVEGNKK